MKRSYLRPGALLIATLLVVLLWSRWSLAQSADWKEDVWHEPQVRYLLADVALGGDIGMYRKYAVEDPDSQEAIRLWDAGARVINGRDFERKAVDNESAKTGKVTRIVRRGSNRTITGSEVFLSTDREFQQPEIRTVIAQLTLGAPPAVFQSRSGEPNISEALRRWDAGVRATNADWYTLAASAAAPRLTYRGSDMSADGTLVRLNSDVAFSETNARYFLADMYLGGSRAFYHRAAETAHEMGCQEAVARFDSGIKITNLDEFERKKVDGKVLITRKRSDTRVSGMDLKLSTD